MAPEQEQAARSNRKWLTGLLFILPCAATVLLMVVYPLVQTFLFSVSKIGLPGFDLEFVGFANFRRILRSSEFYLILKNTLVWTVAALVLRFVLGFVAALMIDTGNKGMVLFRVIVLLPWVMPSIVAANTWRQIYSTDNGLLNGYLKAINPAWNFNWLGSVELAMGSVLVAYAWMGFPFIMLMLVAGMQGIPKDYKEAARIDGANAFQILTHVTLPCLKGIIVILIVLEIINGLNSFDLLFTLTGGGPGKATEILGLYIYRISFSDYDFAGASAVSVMMILAVSICFLFYVPSSARGGR